MTIINAIRSIIKRIKSTGVGLAAATVAVAAIVSLASGCGVRKPPVPPKERVTQRVELSGYQRGNQVILSWTMPAANAGRSSVLNIDRVDIYRLAEPSSAPKTLSEEEFASKSTLIATLSIKESDFGLKGLQHTDNLEFAGQAARLRYAMRFANASGQKAAFSNFLLIEPTAKVAVAPTELAYSLSQDSITLTWRAPDKNIDGTSPVSLLGYNIYRSTSEKEPGKLLNKSPVANPSYADEFFEFGKEYFYFVRAVSVGKDATPIESLETNILRLKPFDTFAPSAPAAITLAVGQNVISIFFAINPEKDIAGYSIYRSTDPQLPKDKWQLVTSKLLKANTFQDTSVEPSKQYFYYITATDNVGNVSEPSEVVTETTR
ncbi:MAG: hypothetical protein K1X36_07760 [Pyrinomonadaceae bacterium]|nr:hypothetical protein [Pyrinomonadaceae bacterium]